MDWPLIKGLLIVGGFLSLLSVFLLTTRDCVNEAIENQALCRERNLEACEVDGLSPSDCLARLCLTCGQGCP